MNPASVNTAAWSETQRTLLIPLVGRARASRDFPDLGFRDPISEHVVERLGVGAAGYERDRKSVWGSIKRTLLFDRVVERFATAHPDGRVLALGAGLCTRAWRLAHRVAAWTEIEFPEVVEVKRALFPPAPAGFTLREGSATDLGLVRAAMAGPGPHLVLAEGVLMFIDEPDAHRVLHAVALAAHRHSELLFDYIHPWVCRLSTVHPSLKLTGARYRWGVRQVSDLGEHMPGSALRHGDLFSASYGALGRGAERIVRALAGGPLYNVAHFTLGGTVPAEERVVR